MLKNKVELSQVELTNWLRCGRKFLQNGATAVLFGSQETVTKAVCFLKERKMRLGKFSCMANSNGC